MSGYMCKASWCARIPENEGEEFCRVCLATRAEAKAEGAAEERERLATIADAEERKLLDGNGLIFDARRSIGNALRGSAPAPAGGKP